MRVELDGQSKMELETVGVGGVLADGEVTRALVASVTAKKVTKCFSLFSSHNS